MGKRDHKIEVFPISRDFISHFGICSSVVLYDDSMSIRCLLIARCVVNILNGHFPFGYIWHINYLICPV